MRRVVYENGGKTLAESNGSKVVLMECRDEIAEKALTLSKVLHSEDTVMRARAIEMLLKGGDPCRL